MRRLAVLIAALALSVLSSGVAQAAATACYDVDVVVNGEALVDEADCVEA